MCSVQTKLAFLVIFVVFKRHSRVWVGPTNLMEGLTDTVVLFSKDIHAAMRWGTIME